MSNYIDIKALRDRMRKCTNNTNITFCASMDDDEVILSWCHKHTTNVLHTDTVFIEFCKPTNGGQLEKLMHKAKRTMRKM